MARQASVYNVSQGDDGEGEGTVGVVRTLRVTIGFPVPRSKWPPGADMGRPFMEPGMIGGVRRSGRRVGVRWPAL